MTATRVLFVDDEARVLEAIEDLLVAEARKWEMCFVLSADQALAELDRQRYDVIVTDMRMPVTDGAALLREVQARHPGVVRIVLSGTSELDTAIRAVPVAHQFVAKPCRRGELENIIERACNLHKLMHDRRLRDLLGGLGRLPSSPRVYGALTRLLADERAGAPEVAALLGRDIAMCAKILQLVNSSFCGVGRRIASIAQAVQYLGVRMIKNLVLSLEVFDVARQPRLAGFSLDALQAEALLVAGCAQAIAGDDRRLADDAFMAGLLHDVGKLVLAVELPQPYGAALRRAADEGIPTLQAELEDLGTTHAEVGAYLLGLWGLPYPIVEAVAHHHEPWRVAQGRFDVLAVLHIADQLARGATLDEGYVAALGVGERLDGWGALVDRQLGLAPAGGAT